MHERSVVQKLHLKPGQKLFMASPPAGLLVGLEDQAPGVLTEDLRTASVVLVFVTDRTDLERSVPSMVRSMDKDAALWVAYPKTSSGVVTDLNRDNIWAWARANGLDAVANFSIDDTWSALRLKVK
jgi:hypothetical protein